MFNFRYEIISYFEVYIEIYMNLFILCIMYERKLDKTLDMFKVITNKDHTTDLV